MRDSDFSGYEVAPVSTQGTGGGAPSSRGDIDAERLGGLQVDARCDQAQMGQTEKYSARADVFRSSSNNGHWLARTKALRGSTEFR